MTIGQLAALSGMPASTIRYYERLGILPVPSRQSGQRRYAASALDSLALLQFAQSCGFRLTEMRELLHGFSPRVSASTRWRKMAKRKRTEMEGQLERLKNMLQLMNRLLECECVDLSECGRIAASMRKNRGFQASSPHLKPGILSVKN